MHLIWYYILSKGLFGVWLIWWNLSRVHRAGPREKIYFKPETVNAAIVTCGGLCPGLNDVIRQVVSMSTIILLSLFLMKLAISYNPWCCRHYSTIWLMGEMHSLDFIYLLLFCNRQLFFEVKNRRKKKFNIVLNFIRILISICFLEFAMNRQFIFCIIMSMYGLTYHAFKNWPLIKYHSFCKLIRIQTTGSRNMG